MNITLRPITEADTDEVLRWRNSDYVRLQFFYRTPIRREEHLDWLHNKVFAGSVYQYIVLADEQPVGCVYLQHFDEKRTEAESGIFLSPDAPARQGIGTKALKLLTREAFDTLGLKRLYARVLATNEASLRLHTACGYRRLASNELPEEDRYLMIDGKQQEIAFYELLCK